MNNHDDIRKLLPAYCGGDLEPAERTRVEQHLNACPECTAALADLEITLRLLRTTPDVEPPPWMTSRIMARLEEENAAKRSWLQRFFFPLHVKLPLEFAALLMVCVSGYYLARNVETTMRQPAPQFEEAPAPSTTPEPPSRVRNAPPRSEKATRPKEAAIEKKAAESPERKPVPEPPPAPQPAMRPASPPVAEPAAPRSPSAYAPPPPATMQERGTSAPDFGFEAQQETPRMQSDRAGNEAAPRRKAAKRLAKQESASAKAMQFPRLRIRLSIDDPATADEAIRQAISRSGGTLPEREQPSSGRRLKARIPAGRLTELVERLEHLGSIAKQPSPPDSEGLVEVDIVW